MRTGKKGISTAVALILIVLVAIVSTSVTYYLTRPAAPPSPEAMLKVGMILPGRVDDLSWNYQCYKNLVKASEEYNLDISWSESVAPATAAGVMREYGAAGYDLLVVCGSQFQDSVLAVYEDYPEMYFYALSGWESRPNVSYGPWPGLKDVHYLLGMIAGSLTETGKVGIINEWPTPDVKNIAIGSMAGVKATNPDAETPYLWIMSWEDASMAKEAALSLIEGGCDVLVTSCGGGTFFGVLSACKERGVPVNGAYVDQHAWAPDLIYVSMVQDISPNIGEAVEDIIAGTFKEVYPIELGAGFVLSPYYQFEEVISEEIKEQVAQAWEDIIAGTLHVPDLEEEDIWLTHG